MYRLATKLDAFIRGKYPKFSVSTNVNGNDLFRSVTGWFKRDGASDPNFAFYMEHQGACYTTLTFPLFFLESTFKDQINPKRQTAGPPEGGSPELDLASLRLSPTLRQPH